MPTAMGWCLRIDGSTLSLTQKRPPFQKGVAFAALIQRRGHQGTLLPIDHWNKRMCHAVSLFRVDYIPLAADHRRGCTSGKRAQRPVGRHARMVQLPSDALLRELGQASLAVALAGSPVASRAASLDTVVLDPLLQFYACSPFETSVL